MTTDPITQNDDWFTTMIMIIIFVSGLLYCSRMVIDEFRNAYQKKQKFTSCMIVKQEENQKSKSSLNIPTWGEIITYRMGIYFSKSRYARPLFLLNGTIILIIFGAMMLLFFGEEELSSSQATWVSWTYVADPGSHADAEGYYGKAIAVIITLGGMLVFALVIGIVSDEIVRMVDSLNEGMSRCIEDDHTLMLGWTDKSLAIIQEIALANLSEGGGVIVVLAECEKQEMEDTLLSAVQMTEHPLKLHGTQVIFRSGNPLVENQLHKVSALTSRSIIALSPDGMTPDEADSRMVRQVLCLKAFHGLKAHVVVEMQDIDNKELVEMVAPDFAEVIIAHDMIGRLMIQCARAPELAAILESLLGFDGSEFYFERWSDLTGEQFGDITFRFDDAIPIGVKVGATNNILLNPENSYEIQEDDLILCLAEDNDSYELNDGSYQKQFASKNWRPTIGGYGKNPRPKKEKLLFCGWRRDMYDMIIQLDNSVAQGSELWLFNTVPIKDRKEMLSDKGNKDELNLKRLSIKNVVGNHIIRRDLNTLVPYNNDGTSGGNSTTLDSFDSILILADDVSTQKGEMQSADSQSLVSLLIIQDIQRRLHREKLGYPAGRVEGKTMNCTPLEPCDPISEILDTRTRSLLQVANCKGYVMSNQIVSAVIAQVAEERDMNPVLGELLSGEGSQIFLRDVSTYLTEKEFRQQLTQEELDNEESSMNNDSSTSSSSGASNTSNSSSGGRHKNFSFWDIAARTKKEREIAIGYKPKDQITTIAGDTCLNPGNKDKPRYWSKGDKIIVLSRYYLAISGKESFNTVERIRRQNQEERRAVL